MRHGTKLHRVEYRWLGYASKHEKGRETCQLESLLLQARTLVAEVIVLPERAWWNRAGVPRLQAASRSPSPSFAHFFFSASLISAVPGDSIRSSHSLKHPRISHRDKAGVKGPGSSCWMKIIF